MVEATFSDSFIEEFWGGGSARHPEHLGFNSHDIVLRILLLTLVADLFLSSIGSEVIVVQRSKGHSYLYRVGFVFPQDRC